MSLCASVKGAIRYQDQFPCLWSAAWVGLDPRCCQYCFTSRWRRFVSFL